MTIFCLRDNLYRDAAPVTFTSFIYREKYPAIYQTCTATAPAPNKTRTRTAKSAPYLPCTGTNSRLKYQDPARMLRQVTLTTPTTGPLAHIFDAVILTARSVLIKFYLDNKNSAPLSGPALARQIAGPPAVTRKLYYLINNTAFYRDSPTARRKIHVLTAKSQFKASGQICFIT